MNFFEQELRNMFSQNKTLKEQKYCGRTMLAKLDEDLRVKLRFVTQGYADHYTAIEATIINRTDGEVDLQQFRFSDIIGKKKGGGDLCDPYIWTYKNEIYWYTPVTEKEKQQIAQTVLEYVGMYQEEGMVPTM